MSTPNSESSFWPVSHAPAPAMPTPGSLLFVLCGCGTEFKRWVTLDDADEDLLKSALLAFEN